MYPHLGYNITYISECSFAFCDHYCFPPEWICLICTYIYITFHSRVVKLLHLSAPCNAAAWKTDTLIARWNECHFNIL